MKPSTKAKRISYLTYNKLVGEADGGRELPNEQFQELLQKYHDSWENRLYVHFARVVGEYKECLRVKPSCFCFCGHTFKSHEWWDVKEKAVRCRTPNCPCERFTYLHRQGSWFLTCTCKHGALEHSFKGKCQKCICNQFNTTFSCMCGASWKDHVTLAESEEERRQLGKSVDTDTVKERLKTKRLEGCGKCTGCKNRMPCYNAKKY